MNNKYWLINIEDMDKYTSDDQKRQLGQILQDIVEGRKNDGKKDRCNLWETKQTLFKGGELFN